MRRTILTAITAIVTAATEEKAGIGEQLIEYMAPMTGQEWGFFAGGFAAGSIIEISTSIEHDSVCLTQVADLAQNGFLAYYYYNLFHNPQEGQNTDPMHLVYSTIYTAKFLDSVNNGGCFQLDISFEEI